MADLTPEQLAFLAHHRVPVEKTVDASGLTKDQYRREMTDRSLWVAFGVTPCRRAGHTLRTRTGHCIQCRPANLAYLRRNDAACDIYVAYSRSRRLVKVGIAESAPYRVQLLNSEMYALAFDWTLKHAQPVEHAGAVEAAVHEAFSFFSVGASYLNNGKIVKAREVFRMPLNLAVALVKHIASERHH